MFFESSDCVPNLEQGGKPRDAHIDGPIFSEIRDRLVALRKADQKVSSDAAKPNSLIRWRLKVLKKLFLSLGEAAFTPNRYCGEKPAVLYSRRSGWSCGSLRAH